MSKIEKRIIGDLGSYIISNRVASPSIKAEATRIVEEAIGEKPEVKEVDYLTLSDLAMGYLGNRVIDTLLTIAEEDMI